MIHLPSTSDIEFRDLFEQGVVDGDAFEHRAHLRLAYVFLCEFDAQDSFQRIRSAIKNYLVVNSKDANKYHETLTQAWVLAVRYFMSKTKPCRSADELIESNPVMLDSAIMLSHYSRELLFSEKSRSEFAEPDKDPIPR